MGVGQQYMVELVRSWNAPSVCCKYHPSDARLREWSRVAHSEDNLPEPAITCDGVSTMPRSVVDGQGSPRPRLEIRRLVTSGPVDNTSCAIGRSACG